MPLIRANALRSLHSSLRAGTARTTPRAAGPLRTQLVARRFASSEGHAGGHGEASSDLPWLLSALAITPPACWYLWPDTTHTEHHGGHGEHDEHHEEKGGEEEGQSGEEEQPQENDAPEEASAPADQSDDDDASKKNDGKASEKSEDSSDKSDGEDKEKSEENPSGEKESKGDEGQDPTAGKEAKESSSGDVSSKQAGMSNTETKHGVPAEQMAEKSKKGSGETETAKSMGTVDPKDGIQGGPGQTGGGKNES